MDDWHRKLAQNLVAATPAGSLPDGAASLEIAFGRARGVLTYALELARAHRIPAAGNVGGDRIWLALGDARVSVTMNRRDGHIVVLQPGDEEVSLRWNDSLQRLVMAGAPIQGEGAKLENPGETDLETDLEAMTRRAIDAIVGSWRARPPSARPLAAPPLDFEDEPTKG